MILFTAPPEISATARPMAVRRHLAKAKTAVTSNYLHLLADPAGDPPDFDVGRLKYIQGPRLVKMHTRLSISSI